LHRLASAGIWCWRDHASAAMDASYIEQWQVRSKELRVEAEQLTYAETSNMMGGLADDYLRIADIAEAMAAIRRVLYYATLEEKAPPNRG
jgi:hypothetical protein